ncbi:MULTISPECIES: NAD(P)/FAD-dependent oxidoreductase [Streptacidiphilus]|uniref:NAD(P)/FAD-dependent oxidoreductase n=1 Tax=Streptacidiphilus cavernicola TaxID=3342716 RepID=A0ABV6UJ00_9ACTN|nr:FAD-dependent oxidoreductase [Streptacidiphilus jeojiense]
MNRIIILGAGYAGMTTAMSLAARTRRRQDVHITLVNPQRRFTERLRLHQVASGQQLADLQIPELMAGTGIEFVEGWVTAVDATAHTVRIDDERTLPYDTLVYALGSVADTETVPGVDDHAHTLTNAASAHALAATLGRLDPGATVVVGGSGLTGVEAAAEIAEQHPDLTVLLLGRAEPGSMMGARAQAYLLAALERLGVRVRAGAEIAKVLPGGVELAGGEHIGADAVLWTTGTRVSPLAAAAGLTVDERGRIVTGDRLRSVSHPDVYAIGDAAAIRQSYGVIHGTCQSGMPTGAYTAAAIAAELKGRQAEPFRFGYLHQPVSLGRHDAVIQFTRPDDTPGRFLLTGRSAVFYKETVSSAPWGVFGRVRKYGAGMTALWRKGGRSTKIT